MASFVFGKVGQWPIPTGIPAQVGPAAAATVIPASFYRHSRVSGNPAARNRHSRLRGNPGRYYLMMVLSTSNREIPAYAGMTVGRAIALRDDGRTITTKSRHPPFLRGMAAKGFPQTTHPLILNLLKDGLRPPTSGCAGWFSCRWLSKSGFAGRRIGYPEQPGRPK